MKPRKSGEVLIVRAALSLLLGSALLGPASAQANAVQNAPAFWKRNTGLWTWISGATTGTASGTYGTQGTGSTSNTPGAREYAYTAADSSGNLWLFGGYLS